MGDLCLCENFIMCVFVYRRWHKMLEAGLSVSRLQAFHADHKYLVMAHSQAAYKRMGKMLAVIDVDNLKVVFCFYMEELMNALKRPANRQYYVNVLYYLMGYLKK